MPSMLSDLVIAMRAVIASREGMFLYPGRRDFFSDSAFNFSTRSVVSGSPPSVDPSLSEAGGEEALPVLDESGEPERVVGGLTAVESAFEAAALDRDKLDPVRRSWAARRGRDEGWFDAGGVTVPEALIRAASWFRDGGIRELEFGFSALSVGAGALTSDAAGGVTDDEEDSSETVVIVRDNEQSNDDQEKSLQFPVTLIYPTLPLRLALAQPQPEALPFTFMFKFTCVKYFRSRLFLEEKMLDTFKFDCFSTDVFYSLPTYYALACVIAFALYRLFGFSNLIIKHDMLRDPPGPRGVPIFGNGFQIPSDKQWLCFHDWSKQYGADILRVLGTIT